MLMSGPSKPGSPHEEISALRKQIDELKAKLAATASKYQRLKDNTELSVVVKTDPHMAEALQVAATALDTAKAQIEDYRHLVTVAAQKADCDSQEIEELTAACEAAAKRAESDARLIDELTKERDDARRVSPQKGKRR